MLHGNLEIPKKIRYKIRSGIICCLCLDVAKKAIIDLHLNMCAILPNSINFENLITGQKSITTLYHAS